MKSGDLAAEVVQDLNRLVSLEVALARQELKEAAGLLVAGIAYVTYRGLRKPALAERIHGVLPDTIGDLPGSVREKFKRRPVRVVISTSAVSAAVSRIARPAPRTGKQAEG